MTKAEPCKDEPYDQKVSIFVPSRYGSGQPIRRDDRDNQVRCVAGVLARVFGGATAEDVASKAERVQGTFRHTVDASERFVDEGIQRVWSGAQASTLSTTSAHDAVQVEACRLRDELGQECVMYEWGREVRFTPREQQARRAVRFGDFDRSQQEEFALMAWHRVESVADLSGVLSLAGWRYPLESEDRRGPSQSLARIAWTESSASRTAWEWLASEGPGDEDLLGLQHSDILVMSAKDSRIRVWLRTKTGYAGPREFPLATPTRPTTRLSIEFAIALLEGDARFTLAELLDGEGTTARFYREIRQQIDRVSAAADKAGVSSASGFAQRLLGRLLFLRFIEEKGWLPRGGLKQAWAVHHEDYYGSFLVPLFQRLNTPPGANESSGTGVPYLNGGLFAISDEDQAAKLPSNLFDPEFTRRTILDLLYRYHFTLDEEAGRDQKVSVDPQMFGRVLESLSPGEERKKKGIHYTPDPIAKALAVGGIFSRLERRAKDEGLPLITNEVLHRLYDGDRTATPPDVAEKLLAILRDMAILDPAVGSGALLVACLEVLLGLEAGCRRVIGEDLRKGSHAWAKSARYYITECLYGVDISAEAVEVARLRLWLFLAVGESRWAPLPELGFNLRVGDTLGFDEVEGQLLEALEDRRNQTKPLQFTDVDKAIDAALQARAAFRAAQGGPAENLKKKFQLLERAERSLREVLGGSAPEDQAPPFSWAVHFSEVFGRANQGFDLVIANPPYVRSAALSDAEKDAFKNRYRSWRGNKDLYFPFIERCFYAPAPPQTARPNRPRTIGLAGKAGSIAFIMPNFAQIQSAENLRSILAEGGHIEQYVDFVDHQVFPTASNYVALLFATAEKRKRKTFPASVVDDLAFARMKAAEPWLDRLEPKAVSYGPGVWHVRSRSAKAGVEATQLGEIADVDVGIQTSLDDFYLCTVVGGSDQPSSVIVRNAFGDMEIERDILFACAKGSKELRGRDFLGRLYVIWPYEEDGTLLTEESLDSRFPLAWKCFQEYRERLMARENGRFRAPKWWRFRRPQGIQAARQEKIIIPSIMPLATAYYDRHGSVTCTASGSGGGGGWTIRLRDTSVANYAELAEYLTSDQCWEWLRINGSPKRGGWRGVDRRILRTCPVPFDRAAR